MGVPTILEQALRNLPSPLQPSMRIFEPLCERLEVPVMCEYVVSRNSQLFTLVKQSASPFHQITTRLCLPELFVRRTARSACKYSGLALLALLSLLALLDLAQLLRRQRQQAMRRHPQDLFFNM